MTELKPYWFYSFGYYLQSLLYMREDLPNDVKHRLLAYGRIGLTIFTSDDRYTKLLPKSSKKAGMLMDEIDIWTGLKLDHFGNRRTNRDIPGLHDWVKSLSTTLEDELDRLHVYCITDKGNLSIDSLVIGATDGYPIETVALFDDFIKREIEEAGRCLAFSRATACGFHILRSIEIAVKAYIYAATGTLPRMTQRNWGEYIRQLDLIDASRDLIDVLKVLKTKRNPVMHPQDVLEVDDAIDVFCVCRAGMSTLIADVRKRSLEAKFRDALGILPTI